MFFMIIYLRQYRFVFDEIMLKSPRCEKLREIFGHQKLEARRNVSFHDDVIFYLRLQTFGAKG